MTYTEKYIMNEAYKIIQVHSTSIILLILMTDIFFPHMYHEGCFTFMIHHFICFLIINKSIFKARM